MASTALLAMVLRPFADALVFLNETQVHASLFPYSWASTLHAARVSLVYQSNVRRTGSKLSWPTYIAGYLIMSWGGTVISNILLSRPPPILYSTHPYINYIGVHLFMTTFLTVFPSLLSNSYKDLALFPLDGLLRANSVSGTVSSLYATSSASSTVNAQLVASPLFHAILGAVASSGGGVTAGTFSTWTPSWFFSTPVFLRGDSGLIGTMDVWGGSLMALIYGVLTAHPAFDGFNKFSGFNKFGASIPVLSSLGAKAAAAVVITILFGIRASVAKVRSSQVKAIKSQ